MLGIQRQCSSTFPYTVSNTLCSPAHRWLKNSGLETPTMSHLKRIRKHESRLTVLLALTTECPQVPTLPNIPGLSEPYAVDVASSAALTQISLKHKNTLWPTIYAPRKKGELEQWTRGRVLWACEAMRRTVQEARAATEYGEVRALVQVSPLDSFRESCSYQLQRMSRCRTRRTIEMPLRCPHRSRITTQGHRPVIPSATQSSTSSAPSRTSAHPPPTQQHPHPPRLQ